MADLKSLATREPIRPDFRILVLSFSSSHPSVVADPRPVSLIVPDVSFKGESATLHNERYGIVRSFKSFCDNHVPGIAHTALNIPDQPIVVMTRDYYCPLRKQLVLHKGCAYGAPVGLYNLEYDTAAFDTTELMPEVIETIIDNDAGFWTAAHRQHEALLQSVLPALEVVFYTADQSISVNNRHLVKRIPAGILRYILSRYLEFKQTEFEYREILLQPDLVFDVYAPNLSVRVKRLAEILKHKCPHIAILATGKGRFTLSVNGNLTFEVR